MKPLLNTLNSNYRIIFLLAVFFSACTAPTRLLNYSAKTSPVYPLETIPEKILILNTYDIAAKKFRDNKEELFISLTNDLMNRAAKNLNEKQQIKTEVIQGYTNTNENSDETIKNLLQKYNATHAIVIRSFDVFFNQSRVDVSKDDDGSKNRQAYYDIESDISYALYSKQALIKEKTVNKVRFHSSRRVLSGLLAAGPNIVTQQDDARNISFDNLSEYLNYFFPGEAQRNRQVFIGKGFEAVGAAINKGDYEAALIESLRLIEDPNKEKAAKAMYNCAVFYERKDQPDEAIKYLRRSLSAFELLPAQIMYDDFRQ